MLTRTIKQVDNPGSGGGDTLFPEGTFEFKLVEPTEGNDRVNVTHYDELRERGNWKDSSGHGFLTSDENQFTGKEQTPWFLGDKEETNVWLEIVEPIDENSPEVAEGKIFFQSFITADGEIGINDLEEEMNGEGQRIRWSTNLDLYFNLAKALGATYIKDGAVAVSEDFCGMLQSDDFDGRKVIATIEHRTKKRGANKGDEYHVLTKFQAV